MQITAEQLRAHRSLESDVRAIFGEVAAENFRLICDGQDSRFRGSYALQIEAYCAERIAELERV